MEPAAAKLIGAGIACIGMGGAGVGVGVIFGNYLAAAVRNPSAAAGQFGNLIFGFALTEALGIFSLLIALLVLFVFASFVTMLGGLGVLGWFGATLPLALTVALVGLELLVAFLQAYVFAILTVIYLNDALHPGH